MKAPPQLQNKNPVGRPRGSMTPENKLRMKTEQMLKKKIYRIADKLFQAQAVPALGTYRIIIKVDVGGIPIIETVHDIKEIDRLLTTCIHGKDFWIVEGSKPDWKAADAMLDRGYGKAKETLDLNADLKFSLKELAERRAGIEQQMLQGEYKDITGNE